MSVATRKAIESVQRDGGRPLVVGTMAMCSMTCPFRGAGADWGRCELVKKVRASTWCDAVVARVLP